MELTRSVSRFICVPLLVGCLSSCSNPDCASPIDTPQEHDTPTEALRPLRLEDAQVCAASIESAISEANSRIAHTNWKETRFTWEVSSTVKEYPRYGEKVFSRDGPWTIRSGDVARFIGDATLLRFSTTDVIVSTRNDSAVSAHFSAAVRLSHDLKVAVESQFMELARVRLSKDRHYDGCVIAGTMTLRPSPIGTGPPSVLHATWAVLLWDERNPRYIWMIPSCSAYPVLCVFPATAVTRR